VKEGFQLVWDSSLILTIMMQGVKRSTIIDDIWYPNGCPLPPNAWVVQQELGGLLEKVAAGGSAAIHEGEVAEAIEDEVAKGGGVPTREDLADYEPKVSEPLAVSYRDYASATVPTPNGGVTVLKSLNILENFELSSMGHNSLEYLSVFIEGVRNAFADRYRFLGDWEQADVPLRGLLSKDYARELAGQIGPGRTAFLQPENVEP
jgi:gamma-glutamyltranspeptidase/glutathione hydrolase